MGQIISDFIPVGASAEKFFHFLTEELLLIDGMKIRGEPTPRSFNSYPLHVKVLPGRHSILFHFHLESREKISAGKYDAYNSRD